MRVNPALISPSVLKNTLGTDKIAIVHFLMRNLGLNSYRLFKKIITFVYPPFYKKMS
jgi:hypothetical protein